MLFSGRHVYVLFLQLNELLSQGCNGSHIIILFCGVITVVFYIVFKDKEL